MKPPILGALALLLIAGPLTAQQIPVPDPVAEGGGMYLVIAGGDTISQHTTERIAAARAFEALVLCRWACDVTYVHDYSVRMRVRWIEVEEVVDPEPEPEPEPDPDPDLDPIEVGPIDGSPQFHRLNTSDLLVEWSAATNATGYLVTHAWGEDIETEIPEVEILDADPGHGGNAWLCVDPTLAGEVVPDRTRCATWHAPAPDPDSTLTWFADSVTVYPTSLVLKIWMENDEVVERDRYQLLGFVWVDDQRLMCVNMMDDFANLHMGWLEVEHEGNAAVAREGAKLHPSNCGNPQATVSASLPATVLVAGLVPQGSYPIEWSAGALFRAP